MLRRFLDNHVLANSAFVVVLLIGIISYIQLPRAQDPDINFNWIQVITALPGASSEDVEKLVTDPLEEAIQKIQDVKFVASTSREGVSDILVRFEDVDERLFDKRLNDLRREIQNQTNTELPDEALDPSVIEITTSNNFPTATLMLTGNANDELLRKTARNVRKDLLQLEGVDSINSSGLTDPELKVVFDAQRLQARGITAQQVADTVRAYFRDVVAGDMRIGAHDWLVRVDGTDADPDYLAGLPVLGTQAEVRIGDVAQVSWGHDDYARLARINGRPGITLAVNKQTRTNILDLVERVNAYVAEKNPLLAERGMQLVLLDDQTQDTREAIQIMESNAILGLVLVMAVTWLFLGSHIAFFIGIGIPFTLAATFWVVSLTGQTLNQNVLLGVVIVLGMLVDDSVVVVESIYYRIQRGAEAMQAALGALKEVFTPVTASVATTLAAFLPLMLLPGIVGKFMFIVPFVVSVALLISLVEAYWLLPAHIAMVRLSLETPGRVQRLRTAFNHWLRLVYGRSLVRVLRWPKLSLIAVLLLFVSAVGAVAGGLVRLEFFAFDPMRAYYINVEMPPGTPVQTTMDTLDLIEQKARRHIEPGEDRAISSTAGHYRTPNQIFMGDNYGHVFISLNPKQPGMRDITDIVEAMRADVMDTAGPRNINFFVLKKGPPVTKPISIKVRGDNFEELRAAVDDLYRILGRIAAVTDISDNDSPGKQELSLQLDTDAVQRSGLNPAEVAETVRLLFDGSVVARMQHDGEKVEVRVQAAPWSYQGIDELLKTAVALPQGGVMPLGELVRVDTGLSRSNIRHYNFRRAITVEAELDKKVMDTLAANNLVREEWQQIRTKHPNVDLDFSGELEDIQESLDAMGLLFLFGVGLIYLILGTQFRSYWQPLMILVTVPLAFIGVVYGLVVTRNPLSLFTLYGVVALAGVAVNAAIIMIDAANQRRSAGMSVLHAILYAARRRVVPILITSLTTIAGLFSLAFGLGGESLIWGPMATAIVSGLAVSTALTLYVIPLLYRVFVRSR